MIGTVDNVERSDALPLRPNLAFANASLERSFALHYHAFYYRYAQASLALGIILIAADFLVDHLVFSSERANIYRLQLCLPILGAAIAYSFSRFARRHWQAMMSGFIVLVACSLFWVLLVIDSQAGMGLRSWVGVLNFVFLEFYCFVILGVQFRYALASGLLILLMFEAAMLLESGSSRLMFCYWSYHTLTLFILASVVGWWREYVLRKDFSMQVSLKEARNAAEAANRAKSVFLATMSHELRTPLNAILGFAELVEVEMSDRGLAEWLTDIRKIRRAGTHLLDLVSEVMDLSKIEAGRMELHPEMFDMKLLVLEVLSSVETLAAKNSVEIHMSCDEAQVYADRLRVRQCILNLVGNACKFTQNGEVTVTGRSENGTNGDWYTVRIADTGIGIGPEDLGRLFSEFTQVDASTHRKYGGSGLGLAISRKLSRLMGGDILAESELGVGSAFTFRFPASRPASAGG
jgi:signal transduction histidine kinase